MEPLILGNPQISITPDSELLSVARFGNASVRRPKPQHPNDLLEP